MPETEPIADEERSAAPVIVLKKKTGHGGHHGGAWKVAYADFVTAMMAFFMVMWLMNSSQKVKEAVGAYFRDPTGAGKQMGSNMAGTGDALEIRKDNLDLLKEEIRQAMKKMPEFDQMKDNVAMTVTGEGLRIELLETEKGMFFESGNVNPSTTGEELLVLLAKQLGLLPNDILIEGHTDAKPFGSADGYTNWELSVDRANTSRKIMEGNGLRPGQVTQVRGFADRRLRLSQDPENAQNRRVSIIVKYMDAEPGEGSPTPAKGGAHKQEKKGH